MSSNLKPGGGNKLQPYIPAGNGEKSGEYTNKGYLKRKDNNVLNCNIINISGCYNFRQSHLVHDVNHIFLEQEESSIPTIGVPNSVVKIKKDGYITSERYYNNKGEAYLDIDYTCHGNPKKHPCVPHIHKWTKDENGELQRQKWEIFK